VCHAIQTPVRVKQQEVKSIQDKALVFQLMTVGNQTTD
jgi:hypothetical protein